MNNLQSKQLEQILFFYCKLVFVSIQNIIESIC